MQHANGDLRQNAPNTATSSLRALTELGIETQTVEHPPAFTVADSSSIEIPLPGAHTKNLFLKDDEGSLVLVVAKSSTRVDLKALSNAWRGTVFVWQARTADGCARCDAWVRDGLRRHQRHGAAREASIIDQALMATTASTVIRSKTQRRRTLHVTTFCGSFARPAMNRAIMVLTAA